MSLAEQMIRAASDDPSALLTGWWERSEFRLGDAPETTCPEKLDITGLRRLLLRWSPRTFAAGRWRFTIAFELCDDAGRYPYEVKVGNHEGVTAENVQGGGAGLYEVTLEHALHAPVWLEAHISIMRAAFHGEFSLRGMSIERIDG